MIQASQNSAASNWRERSGTINSAALDRTQMDFRARHAGGNSSPTRGLERAARNYKYEVI